MPHGWSCTQIYILVNEKKDTQGTVSARGGGSHDQREVPWEA
jgi:hypothetical protein